MADAMIEAGNPLPISLEVTNYLGSVMIRPKFFILHIFFLVAWSMHITPTDVISKASEEESEPICHGEIDISGHTILHNRIEQKKENLKKD